MLRVPPLMERTPEEIQRFYQAALLGLRQLDATEPAARRFGPEADAQWKRFAGHLGVGDRVDLLCRDAAVSWGAAFSPALCFELEGVAPDEPFGPGWPGVGEHEAKKLWAQAEARPQARNTEALDEATSILGDGEAAVNGRLDDLTPGSKLLVGGLAAIRAVAHAFAANPSLRWEDQVVVVADRFEERQLAGLSAVLLNATKATHIVGPEKADQAARVGVVSGDASDAVASAVGRARGR